MFSHGLVYRVSRDQSTILELPREICHRHRLLTPPTGSITTQLERHRRKFITNASFKHVAAPSRGTKEKIQTKNENTAAVRHSKKSRLYLRNAVTGNIECRLGHTVASSVEYSLMGGPRHEIGSGMERCSISGKSPTGLKKSSDYSLTSRLTSNPDEHKYGTDISYSITNNSLHVASNFPPGKVMHTSYRNTNLNVRFPMVVPGKKGSYDSNPIAHHPPFKLKHAQRANMSGTVHLDHMVDKRKTHYPLCGDISQTYVSSCRYHVNDL